MNPTHTPPAGRESRAAVSRRRERVSLERWIAVVRLGAIPFLLVQLVLIPPAWPPGMLVVATVFGLSSLVVISLYVRRPLALAEERVRIAIFAVDCLAFAGALADYAGPGDLTWVTFILVLLSAAVRWDAKGAAAAVAVFLAVDLPLDIATPPYTHLVFQAGSVTFKVGLITLLGFFFAVQFRSFSRVSHDYEAQAEALRRQTDILVHSESQMRVIWDTALAAMITMNQDGIVIDWNRRAEDTFGWLKGEVIGRRLSETIVPAQHRPAHEAGLEEFRRTGKGPVLGQTIEITALHRSGREFPIELSISPSSTMDGQTTFMAFLRDNTDRKRTEELQALQLGVTRALSEARSTEEAAPAILEELGSRLGQVLAQWWEVDPGRELLTWKESWFAQGLSAVDFIADSQAMTFAPGVGFPGRTWAQARASTMEDVQADQNFPRGAQAREAGLHAALAFPILNGLEVTGVIELFSTEPGRPTEQSMRSVASIGSQIGQFVERRRAERSLEAARERITGVLENVADGIITMDQNGRVQSLNAAARRLFGYLAEDVIGTTVDTLISDANREQLLTRLLVFTTQGGSRSEAAPALETVGRRMDGSTFPLELRPSEMSLAGQRVFIVSLRDISDRRAQTEALQYQALHDALTGLPNRTLVGDRLHQAIASATREKRPVALLLLDLDRFKEVNDTMGHAYGDLLLQQVASRIRNLLREADTVARLGGDEFAILPSGATAKEGAVRTAQKVVKAFEKPFIIDDRAFDIRASIGIALYPQHGEDAETLMRRADVAMYVAKRGKKPYELYEASYDSDTALRLALMSELRHATDRDEMVLHYLPKIDLRTDRVVAVEALLRWIHPDRGTLTPDQFVGYAEQTEIINSVTRWVLDASLKQLRAWMDAGIEIGMTVNMSARNLHDPELPNMVARLLTTWKVPAELLMMEITEGIAMDSAAEERLLQLAAMGVGLSIDDFGTGYSSLAYLKRLPMEELKIDRSFVSGMDLNPDDAAIVRPTIDLGHNLGLRVVAEGVENEAVLEMLVTYGCDLAQGHYICPPKDAAEFVKWFNSYAAGGARPSRGPALRAGDGQKT
ncbi:MAG TPA: EAL domain-containing protein [Candidatus Dormibacteraeota bacterium]